MGRWPLVLLGVLALAVYGESIAFEFVDYDDQRILLGQRHLFAAPSFLDGARAIFTALPREEPLVVRDLSWLVDSRVFGFGDPIGPHLGNTLLNAAVVLLLVAWIGRLTGRRRAAIGCGLAFLVMPAHVEPVAWVMGRKDVLSSALALLALLLVELEADAKAPARRRLFYLGHLALVPLAALAKISTVPLFLVMAMQASLRPVLKGELPPSAPFASLVSSRRLLRFAPHAALAVLVFRWYQSTLAAWGMFGRGPPLGLEHAGTLLEKAPEVLATYARLVLWPVDLAVFYDRPAVGVAPSTATLALGVGLGLGLCTLLVLALGRRKDLAFFLVGAGLLFVPYANLVYIGIWVANRYLYLVSGLLLAAAALAIDDLLRARPRLAAPVGVALAGLGLAQLGLTLFHLHAWRDNASLWAHEMRSPEASLLAHSGLARVEVLAAEAAPPGPVRWAAADRALAIVDRGVARYEALGVRPDPRYFNYQRVALAKLHHFRGRALGLRGAPLEVQLEHYRRAHALDPGLPLHNQRLAELTFQLALGAAGEARLRLARESLGWFAEYARLQRAAAGGAPDLARALRSNYERFEGLEADVAARLSELEPR